MPQVWPLAPATPLPWSWYWRFEDGEPNCGVFSEVRVGHAYAVARCPRYVKKAQWKQDAVFIVRACNAYADLVKACSAFIARFDSRNGRRADTDYVAGLIRAALIKAAAPVDAVEEQGSRNREDPPSSPSRERVKVLEEALTKALRLKGGWREAIVELEDFCSEPVRLRNMIAAADQLDEWAESTRAVLAGGKING